jgi:hypothetical protein
MKNIYLIPTEKPSRLIPHTNSCQIKLKDVDKQTRKYYKYSIYITSDEEIETGNYYLCKLSMRIKKCIGDEYFNNIDEKKIILTNDTNLIKDCVQAIDDEFLEWFVENQSCEKVETMFSDIRDPMKGSYRLYYINIPEKEFKKETLEEAAKNSKNYTKESNGFPKMQSFIDDAKWQAERMYSEKEVELIALEMVSWTLDNIGNKNAISSVKFDEIISKFKKK